MARKNLLSHLMAPPADESSNLEGEGRELPTSPPPQRKGSFRGVGVVGAMSESLGAMAADLQTAKDQAARILEGDTILEITTDLIDPSFVSDRLGDGGDISTLAASIHEFGQKAPVLLRPHPEENGRYQIAFGHRRVRVMREMKRPVRAVVKKMSDEELVIAQGQENQNRRDLSFIERAIFACRLETQSIRRDVIISALGVDKTELSRLISIGTSVPSGLIEAIGPAPKIGRRRWLLLAESLEALDWSVEAKRITAICVGAKDSDTRFDLVLRSLNTSKVAEKDETVNEASLFLFEKKRGVIRIVFDEDALPKAMIEECAGKLQALCANYRMTN